MGIWFYEDQTPLTRIGVKTKQMLHLEKSPYQEIMVIDTWEYGRLLALDEVIQITELDEFAYHEMLVHVPLCSHPNPEQVLVVGGGDGGSVREVCRHDTVQRVVLAEIDERVIQTAIDFFPTVSCALKDNPRLDIQVGDAIDYVHDHPNSFDVIIVDSSDPVDHGEGLFKRSFYEDVYSALKPGGMVAVQGESPWLHQDLVKRIYGDLQDIFPVADIFWSNIPTYPTGAMVFPFGSKGTVPRKPVRKPNGVLNYYSEDMHHSAFLIPEYLKRLLGRD